MIATTEFLEKRFETFNDAYFGGALPPVPLKLSRAVRSLGACTYKKRRKLLGGYKYYDFRIRVSTKYDLPECRPASADPARRCRARAPPVC